MAGINDDTPLPEPSEIDGSAAPVVPPAAAEEHVPFATDPTPDSAGDDDELLIKPKDQPVAEEEAPAKRKAVRAYIPVMLHQNVFIENAKDLVPTDADKPVHLMLSQSTAEDVQRKLQSINAADVKSDVPVHEIYDWMLSLNDGTELLQDSDLHLRALDRPGSSWRQRLQGERHFIMPAYKGFDPSTLASTMSGADAVDLFMNGTGMGRPVRWPLYRSGIWINIRPASIAYLAEIDRSLSFERAQLGMDTAGLVNSNDSLIFDEKLVDAALRLVTWTNADVSSPMQLKDLIVTHDIPSLIMAMAAATFADGFTTGVVCTSVTCRHENNFDADLRRMSYVDSSRFTPQQIAFMDEVDIEPKHSIEAIRAYQAQFAQFEEATHEYKGRVFEFGTGSISRIFGLGHAWISQINLAMTEALQDKDVDPIKRTRILQSILTAETLCRYGHYVKAIRIPQLDTNKNEIIVRIEDPNSILDILRHMMTDDEGSSALIDAIQNYIVNTEIVVHGYRNMKCRKCGNYHLDDQGEAKLILPIKVGQTFFTLLQTKLRVSGIQPVTNLEASGILATVQQELDNELRTLSIQEQQSLQSMQQSSSEMPTT